MTQNSDCESLVACDRCGDSGWLYYAPTNRPGVMMHLHPSDPNTKDIDMPARLLILEACSCLVGQKKVIIQ